jgi:hypothetical protein
MKPAAPHRSRRPRRGVVAIWFELLLGGAQIAAVGTGGYVIARGHMDWCDAQERLAASGYSMDVLEIARPAIPDSENFGATPALKGIATRKEDLTPGLTAKLERLKRVDPAPPAVRGSREAPRPETDFIKPLDWKAWRAWLTGPVDWEVPSLTAEPDDAKAVLAALRSRDEPLLEELLTASRRPRAAFLPGEAQRMKDLIAREDLIPDVLPTVGPLMQLSRMLLLRQEAAPATGDTREAGDLMSSHFALIRLAAHDSSFISLLVSRSMETHQLRVLHRALAAHRLTDADLASCQKFLSSLNMARSLNASFNMEMATVVRMIQLVVVQEMEAAAAPRFQRLNRDFMEKFFVEGNCALIVNHFLHRAPYLEKSDWPGLLRNEEEWEKKARDLSYLDGLRLSLGLSNLTGNSSLLYIFVHSEIQRRLFIVACALERRRLEGQELPDTLTDLPPRLLAEIPRDLDGQPIRYHPTPDGFVVWSVALNLTDDWKGAPPPKPLRPDEARHHPDWQIRVP